MSENMEDDLLGLLDSKEDAFVKKEEPVVQNTGVSSVGADGKINLWEDTNIPKVPFNTAHLHNVDKSFAIFLHTGEGGLPPEIEEKFIELSKVLLGKGFIYRYGGDSNNDLYGKILNIEGGLIDTYLPWKKFNTTVTAKLSKPTEQAYKHAMHYHLGFAKMKPTVRAMLAKDVHVLVGEDCKRPVRFMICYTPDGCETKEKINYKTTGFASFPITVACAANIPVFNLKNDDAVNRLVEYIKTIN